MKVVITVKFRFPEGVASKSGDFPLRRRLPEQVAFDWIQQIKREVHFEELFEVVVNEKEDITEKVKELHKHSRENEISL